MAKYCSYCGAENPDDAVTCFNCNQERSISQLSQPEQQPVLPAQPVQVVQQSYIQQSQQTEQSSYIPCQQSAPASHKKSKVPLVIGIVAAICVVALAVTAIVTGGFGLFAGKVVSSDDNGINETAAYSDTETVSTDPPAESTEVSGDMVLWLDETKLNTDSKYHLGMTVAEVNKQLKADGILVLVSGKTSIETAPLYFYFDDDGKLVLIDLFVENETGAIVTTAKNLVISDTKESIIQKYGQPLHEPYTQDGVMMLAYKMGDQYVEFDLQLTRDGEPTYGESYPDGMYLSQIDITSNPNMCIALQAYGDAESSTGD